MVGRDEDVRERRQAIELARAPPGAADGLELAQHVDGDRLGLADDDGVDQPGEWERVGEGEGTAGEEERVALVAVDAPGGMPAASSSWTRPASSSSYATLTATTGKASSGFSDSYVTGRSAAPFRPTSPSSARNARSHAMPGVSMMAR